MKTYYKFALVALLFISVIFNSCTQEDPVLPPPQQNICNETTETSQVSINCFDFNPYSPYYYQVVCVFTIKKESTKRAGDCGNKPSEECKNYVSVKNVSSMQISFPYNVNYSLNLYNWNYQNAVTIEPGKTTSFEYINDNCGSLQLGQTLIS